MGKWVIRWVGEWVGGEVAGLAVRLNPLPWISGPSVRHLVGLACPLESYTLDLQFDLVVNVRSDVTSRLNRRSRVKDSSGQARPTRFITLGPEIQGKGLKRTSETYRIPGAPTIAGGWAGVRGFRQVSLSPLILNPGPQVRR